MARWARVVNTRIMSIVDVQPTANSQPAAWLSQFQQLPELFEKFITDRYTYVNGVYEPPYLDELRVKMLKDLAKKRYDEEQAGMTINLPNGVTVTAMTDDRSKTLLLGARQKAYREIDKAIKDSIASGGTEEEGRVIGENIQHTFAPGFTGPARMTNIIFILFADRIGDYTQNCFDRWGDIADLLNAATSAAQLYQIFEDNIDTGWELPPIVWPTPIESPTPSEP